MVTFSTSTQAAIARAAAATGVPLALADAIAMQESGGNPYAIGDSGHSVGLYQLNDQGEGAGLSVSAREDPYQNAFIALSRVGALYRRDPSADPGSLAAAAQRPANPAAYAAAVDAILEANPPSNSSAGGTAATNPAPTGVLAGIGHGLADQLSGLGKNVETVIGANLIGFLLAGIALYVIFAPDVAGTSRV